MIDPQMASDVLGSPPPVWSNKHSRNISGLAGGLHLSNWAIS